MTDDLWHPLLDLELPTAAVLECLGPRPAGTTAARRAQVQGACALLRRSSASLGLELQGDAGRLGGCAEHEDTLPGIAVVFDASSGAEALAWAFALREGLRGAWSVSYGRPARGWGGTRREVCARAGVELEGARVRVGFTRGHLLEITVALPDAGEKHLAAELAVEGLLGESLCDRWVSAVESVSLPRSGGLRVIGNVDPAEGMHPLEELPDIVQRARHLVLEQLSALPLWRRPPLAEWTALEVEPDLGDLQRDRVLAVTCLPELLKCALEGQPFYSGRFSRHGERFAYVQMPCEGSRAGEGRAPRRERVENELDAALREARLGAVIGSGLGARTEYFDLALAGAAQLRTVVACLRSLRLSHAATLGFYDSEFAARLVALNP